jgi:chemotaxis protein MotB
MMAAMGSYFGNEYKKESSVGVIKTPMQGEPVVLLKEKVHNLINKYDLGSSVKLAETERGVVVRIYDDILFNSGSSDLRNYSRIILSNVARVLKELPNDVRIEGHTDNVPIKSSVYLSNWHLSISRATNTAYYLMMNEGLPQERVTIVGYAEYKPVDINSTPEGRANNRRVDIVILN